MVKVLAFSGSTRPESLNQMLVQAAAREARALGAQVTVVCLGDFEIPLYDPVLEAQQGLPEGARAFKRLLMAHQAWLIASPEYNGFFTPALKNALDWASRREEGEPPKAAFAGKVAAIMAAAPGRLGGVRGLPMLRLLLNNLGVLVLPEQIAVPQAERVLDAQGRLRDEALHRRLHTMVARLLEVASGLRRDEPLSV